MVEIVIQLVDLINTNPVLYLVIISALVTLISTLVTLWLTNQEHLKGLKERQKHLQKEMKKHKPGDKMFMELQNEMMQLSMTMMKSSFKPMFVTLIPFLLLFVWLRNVFDPILNHWIWWYIGSSLIASLIFRKIFRMA